jgi:hypothetical protein
MIRKLTLPEMLIAIDRISGDCDGDAAHFELIKDVATVVAKYSGGKYTGQTRASYGALAHIKMVDVPSNEGIYAGSPFVQELGAVLKDTEEWALQFVPVES